MGELASTRLYLVRHAAPAEEWQADRRLSGWYDPPLGEQGFAQATRTAERLAARCEPPVLYASPLRRAWQTAEVVAARLQLAIVAHPDLREVSCGTLDGMPHDEVRERHPELWQRNIAQCDESFRWPGGESYREFRHRVRRALDTIAARHAGREVVVVTHAGVITQALGMLNGWSAARWDRSRPAPAAIVAIAWQTPARARGAA